MLQWWKANSQQIDYKITILDEMKPFTVYQAISIVQLLHKKKKKKIHLLSKNLHFALIVMRDTESVWLHGSSEKNRSGDLHRKHFQSSYELMELGKRKKSTQ